MVAGCASAGAPQLETAQSPEQTEELDCGRIMGRMQVRILSLRSEGRRTQPTALARSMQSVGTSIGLSEGYATNPDDRYNRELAELQAYNAKLGEKGCKTYDLERELAETDLSVTPRPR